LPNSVRVLDPTVLFLIHGGQYNDYDSSPDYGEHSMPNNIDGQQKLRLAQARRLIENLGGELCLCCIYGYFYLGKELHEMGLHIHIQ
jgi:hypothetical protein